MLPWSGFRLIRMSRTSESLTKPAKVCISVVLAFAVFFATVWISLTTLQVFNPFNYVRLIASVWIGVTGSILTLLAFYYSNWKGVMVSNDRNIFPRIAAWLSVLFVLDSLIIEPYLLRYFFPRLDLGGSLRWQFQLIVAGLLAAAVAIHRRRWWWVLFSIVATAFGTLWLCGIFLAE
jgi:hypothetical protein